MLSNKCVLRGSSRVLWHTSFLIGFLVLISLGSTSKVVQAVSVNAPLYVLLKSEIPPEKAEEESYRAFLNTGDLWKWTGNKSEKLAQVTHWGFNAVPVTSPDGHYIAYQSSPQITIDYLKSDASHAEGVVQDALPFNLWIIDTQTDKAKRLTEQSPSASIDFANFDLVNGITRSVPVWSPDSSKIAWIEADSSAAMKVVDDSKFMPRLMIYDIATAQTEVRSNPIDLPDYASPQAGGTAMGDMIPQWGSAGIVIGYYDPNDQEIYAIYDLTGKRQQEVRSARHNNFPAYAWVNDGQQVYLGLRDSSGWSLHDARTGKNKTFNGQIEGYSLLAEKSNVLRVNGDGNWELVGSNGSIQQLTDCRFDDPQAAFVVLSPDGEQAACFTAAKNLVSIYTTAGLLTQLPADENQFVGMSWGPMGWRVVGN